MEVVVYIILVNYNGFKVTLDCIESLSKLKYKNYNLVVVDNNSKNSELELLRNSKDTYKFTLLELKENLGFSGGNNVGIEYAMENGADYVLLLNNDTEVDSNFLNELIKYSNKNTATISKIYYYNNPNKIWYDGGDILVNKGKAIHYNIGKIDSNPNDINIKSCSFATGCCILLHKNIIEKVGLLDDDFFMYSEDADYSIRIIKNGFNIKYIPQSKIWHKVSSSSGGESSPLSLYYMERNRLYLLKKHRDFFNKRAFLYVYVTRLIKLTTGVIFRKKNTKYIFEGLMDYYKGKIGKKEF